MNQSPPLKLIEDCQKLLRAGKLEPFEERTVDDITDGYLCYGSMSSAEKKFLEDLVKTKN